MSDIVVKYKNEFSPNTGSISEVSWKNPSVKSFLESLFGLRDHESLTGIVVTEQGIKAHFVTK